MDRGRRLSERTRRRWVPALLALLLTLVFGLLPPLHSPARSQPVGAGGSTATAASASSSPAPSRSGEEIRAVWLTSNDMDVLRDHRRLRQAMQQLAELHFNTIYPVVYNGGLVYYPSAVSEREGLQDFQYRGLEGQDILADVIAEGHRQGLLVLPWFEFGFMVPPGSVLTRRHPEWLSRRRDGSVTSISAAGEVSWLNPLHPQVQSLLRDLILEIATQYDADGIQFDDHTTLPSDFGYDAYTTSLYQRSTKKIPPADFSDGAWLKWRADGISAFMARLHGELEQRRPGFLVSVSPNYYDFAYKRQLQDWLAWLRQGSVDEVVVQIYRPDLQSFEAELNRPEFAIARQRVPTAVGILTGQRTAPVPIERVVAQAEAARRRGLGAAFFYYETLWEEAGSDESPQQRRGVLASLFRLRASRQAVAAGPQQPLSPAAPAATPPAVAPLAAPPPAAAPLVNPSPAGSASGGPSPSAPPPASVPTAPPPAPAWKPAELPPPAIPESPQPLSSPPGFESPLGPPLRLPPQDRSAPIRGDEPASDLPASEPPASEPPAIDPSWGPYNGAVEPPAPLP